MFNLICLFLSGILGILAVNLIEIDNLNQASEQNTNLARYVSKHWANMTLSVVMVLAAVIGRQYVAQLEAAGKSLFVGVFAIGMCGPTVAQFVRTRAVSVLTSMGPKT